MSEDTQKPNDQLILVVGYSATGKSASLRNIRNQERWLYLNTEAGKRLPFRNNFDAKRIEDPYQVHEAFDYATHSAPQDYDGIIVDSTTFLMNMFETMYISTSTNTMAAWGSYSLFWKVLMQEKVTRFARPVIMIAHVRDELDEKSMEIKTSVPIKGSTKNEGVESYFSCIVAAKRLTLKELEPFKSNLLHIEDEDKDLGFKHVFQTRLTSKTTGERLRSPMGLFDKSQTYMDNDAQILLDHLHSFYGS